MKRGRRSGVGGMGWSGKYEVEWSRDKSDEVGGDGIK